MQRLMLVLIGVLIIVIGVGYLYLGHRHQQQMAELQTASDQRQAALEQRTDQLARDLALDFTAALAGGIVNDVVGGDRKLLQDRIVAAVKGRRVARIIVLDPTGAVLASTDLRFTNGTMEDPTSRRVLTVDDVTVVSPADDGGQLEVAAPVRVAAQSVAAVWVTFDLQVPAGA